MNQNLKDAYFSVSLHKDSRKLKRFLWAGDLYEFLYLYFGLEPVPRIFTNFIKVPISALKRLKMRVIIYLDDLSILKKCVADPAQEIEYLRLIEFPSYDFVITRGKNREDKGSMPEVIQGIRSMTSRFGKINRNTFFNRLSSAPRSSTVLLFTTAANCISKTKAVVLLHFGKADSHGKKMSYYGGSTIWNFAMTDWLYNHRHRFLFRQMYPKKAGGCMSRDQNRR